MVTLRTLCPKLCQRGTRCAGFQPMLLFLAEFRKKPNATRSPGRQSEVSQLHADFPLRSAPINRKRRGNIYFTAEKVKFLKEMAWICKAYYYAKEQWAEGQSKWSLWGEVVSM